MLQSGQFVALTGKLSLSTASKSHLMNRPSRTRTEPRGEDRRLDGIDEGAATLRALHEAGGIEDRLGSGSFAGPRKVIMEPISSPEFPTTLPPTASGSSFGHLYTYTAP